MKVTLKLQVRNVEKQFRVSIYEQENGQFYAIKVRTDEPMGTPGSLTIRGNISRDEAIGMAEL
jgi:uncharacterized protein (DUF2147 family)